MSVDGEQEREVLGGPQNHELARYFGIWFYRFNG